jgi:transketolase
MGRKEVAVSRALAARVRAHCLRMTYATKSPHLGSMLSMADLLAVLYTSILRSAPNETDSPGRDRFLLSKGHGGAALLATLAESGYFPIEWLETYRREGGKLGGHISHDVPGVEFSTGSLGHALPVAAGLAFSGKLGGRRHRVYCLMGDGDCMEGSTWEAAMFSSHHHLDNLVGVIDYNRVTALGRVEDVVELEPLDQRWGAFGWSVKRIDGHDHEQIHEAFSYLPFEAGKPSMIVARTVKGKGARWTEGEVGSHYAVPTEAELEEALLALERLR